MVDNKTENAAIEAAFENFTTQRKDIGIILINQHVSIGLDSMGDCFDAMGCFFERLADL